MKMPSGDKRMMNRSLDPALKMRFFGGQLPMEAENVSRPVFPHSRFLLTMVSRRPLIRKTGFSRNDAARLCRDRI